jgi:hypothetical protein
MLVVSRATKFSEMKAQTGNSAPSTAVPAARTTRMKIAEAKAGCCQFG